MLSAPQSEPSPGTTSSISHSRQIKDNVSVNLEIGKKMILLSMIRHPLSAMRTRVCVVRTWVVSCFMDVFFVCCGKSCGGVLTSFVRILFALSKYQRPHVTVCSFLRKELPRATSDSAGQDRTAIRRCQVNNCSLAVQHQAC